MYLHGHLVWGVHYSNNVFSEHTSNFAERQLHYNISVISHHFKLKTDVYSITPFYSFSMTDKKIVSILRISWNYLENYIIQNYKKSPVWANLLIRFTKKSSIE